MITSENLPGTFNQQEILQTITDFYAADKRVLDVLLFGSLARGNWDQFSDLDLDIVMSDNILIDARVELKELCTEIKQKHGFDALIIADREEGDVVLSNLVELSIRYHILSDTKPAVLDTMQSLSGKLSLDEIRAAANYAYHTEPRALVKSVNAYLRYVLALHHAIKRQRLWMALEMLHRLRAELMLIYSVSHGGLRPIHCFDAQASPELHKLLASLSPQTTLGSVIVAFRSTIGLLENHLDDFCNGNYQLTTSQKHILTQLKQLPMYRENKTEAGRIGH